MPKIPPPQPWPIRVTHWLNVFFLAILAGSGLQIFVAYPRLGPRGADYGFYPWQGADPPEALTLGGWLAGSRHLHFAFAWLFVVNAIAYGAYFFSSGEWRRRLFIPRRDAKNALSTLLYYVRIRKVAPPSELYNGLQRLAYTGILALAPLAVLTGLVLYKPVQLWWLTAIFGGYDAARALHFVILVVLALFTVSHVAQVAIHPRTLVEMLLGRFPERKAKAAK